MVQGFKDSSTMNITELPDLNGHINTSPMFKPKGPTDMNISVLEPVLFEKKLHNITLSHSVFRVTTFFQFASTNLTIKLCKDELTDCKSQITQLTIQVNNMFSTLDQTNPKHGTDQ